MFTVNSLVMIFDCSERTLQGNSCSQRLTLNFVYRFKSFLAIFVGSEHVNRKCHAGVSLRLSRDNCPLEVYHMIALDQWRNRKILREDSSQMQHQNSTTTREPRLRWSRSYNSTTRKKLLMRAVPPDNLHINFFNSRDSHRMQGFTLFHFRGVHDPLHIYDLILLTPHLLEGSPQVP